MGYLLIGLFVFITLGFAWALTDENIKELNKRLNKQLWKKNLYHIKRL